MSTPAVDSLAKVLAAAIAPHPLVVAPDTPVVDAIAAMARHQTLAATGEQDSLTNLHQIARSSCVLVVEAGKLVGLLRERDVVRLLGAGQSLTGLTVSEGMTSPVVTLRQSDFTTLEVAADRLHRHAMGYLPVMGDQGEVLGIITPETLAAIPGRTHRDGMVAYGIPEQQDSQPLEKQEQQRQDHKNAAHLKSAQRIAQLGSWEFDPLTEEITWSDEVFRIFGRDLAAGPPTYAELTRLFHPEDQAYHHETVQRGIETGQPYDLECRAYHADGHLIYIQARGEPILDASGQLIQFVGTVLDISDHKRAEIELRSLSDRLTLALQSGAIGTWDWDFIQEASWDRRMYEIYDLQDLDRPATYQDWTQCLHPDDLEATEAAFKAAIRGEQAFNVEFRMRRRNGEQRWVKASALVQRNAQGEPLRMTGINYDITDSKQAEEELRQTTAQLEASNRELEAFAYSVSHDLRSPLRAIDGFSRTLLEDYGDQLDAQGTEYFGRIRRNVQRMGLLIDDLLRLSRVSRAAMRYGAVNLSALVEEQIAQCRSLEPERQVEVAIAPEAIVWADRALMEGVISNLVQNAWKFTSHHPRARIEFGAMAKGRSQTIAPQEEPIYFIRDDGAGFDMAYGDKIFGVFQRLHSLEEFPGTGIGLATVQRAIHRHGGEVWAEAAVEQGATIYFTVPSPSHA